MQAGLRGPQGDPERRRDGWQREVEVVVEDDHGPHLRVEAKEAAFELVSVREDRVEAFGYRDLERGELHVHPVAADPPCLIDTGTDEQLVEPRVEAVRVAERG